MILGVMSILLTGCQESEENEKPKVYLEHYNKTVYEPVAVTRGDIIPESVLNLTCTSLDRETYSIPFEGMQVDEVHVTTGDLIKKGDLLLSCKAEEIKKQIEQYEEQTEQNQMLYEHYKSLDEINSSDRNKVVLEQLKRSIEVDQLYIKELEAKLSSYHIVAEADGIVLSIADGLDNATINATKNLITVIYSDGLYSGDSKEEMNFEEDKVYEAYYGLTSYKIKLVSETRANGISHYQFKLTDDENNFCSKDKLELSLTKEPMKDVLYLPENCIKQKDDQAHVYLLDENGFLDYVEVKVGNTVDGKTVILSGLEEGDKVVAK